MTLKLYYDDLRLLPYSWRNHFEFLLAFGHEELILQVTPTISSDCQLRSEVAHNISKVLRASLVARFMALFKWSDCLPYCPRNDAFKLVLQSRVTHHRNNYWVIIGGGGRR